jgi:hypothetical protein
VDPRAGLDDVEKRKCLTHRDSNPDPSVVQPVDSSYTVVADATYNGKERRQEINFCNLLIFLWQLRVQSSEYKTPCVVVGGYQYFE